MVNGLSRLVKGPDSFRSKRVSWLGRIVQGSDFFDSRRNESDRQGQRQNLFRVNNCSCVMYGYSKVRIGSAICSLENSFGKIKIVWKTN